MNLPEGLIDFIRSLSPDRINRKNLSMISASRAKRARGKEQSHRGTEDAEIFILSFLLRTNRKDKPLTFRE
jgi:hypothetical protein